MGLTPVKVGHPLQGMEVQEKRRPGLKGLKTYKKLLRKISNISVNCKLKAIYITSQRKAFHRQRIP